ncbi:MAG: hypothetical protein ACR2PT_00470 [Endozoicomonas sp.]
MFKRIPCWLLTASLLSPLSVSALDCEKYLEQSNDDQFKELFDRQVGLIEFLRMEQNGNKLVTVMKNATRLNQRGELSITDFIDEIKANYQFPEEDLKTLDGGIDELEMTARCYHNGNTEDVEGGTIVKWLYHELGETENPFIGFLLPRDEAESDQAAGETGSEGTDEGAVVKPVTRSKVYATTPQQCGATGCKFDTMEQSKVTRDAVQLIYTPKSAVEEVKKPVAVNTVDPNGKEWPMESVLLEVHLNKTGEIFSKPEIYARVLYWVGGELQRVSAIPIDWALHKGANMGQTRLLIWQDADVVEITLMERDVKFPFRKSCSLIASIIHWGLTVATKESKTTHIISEGLALAKTDASLDNGLLARLAKWQEDDFIDEGRLVREKALENANLYLKNDTLMKFKHETHSELEALKRRIQLGLDLEDGNSDDENGNPEEVAKGSHTHDEH